MLKIPKVILIIERSRAFGRGLLQGIVHYSNLHKPWLFYMEPEFYKRGREISYKWIKKLNADGIIAHTWDTKMKEMIINLGIPAMICGLEKPIANTYRITTDENAIGRTAAEYFFERGFQQFAYCGFRDMIWSQQRCKFFNKKVTEYGVKTFIYNQPKAYRSRRTDDEHFNIAKWLDSLPKPIAVMACNDDRSLDVLSGCRLAEIKVPSEVAILGVDNDELACGLSLPQLSSISLSTKKAGYEAAQILDRLMNAQNLKNCEKEILIKPLDVVTRMSTDIIAVEDQKVAKAIQFIHNHSKSAIQVSDVANAVGLSRRALQQRFRKALARSVHEEIKNTCVNEIANMLINTNLSISQIARNLGYSSESNISRYFKEKRGISPSEYRRKFSSE